MNGWLALGIAAAIIVLGVVATRLGWIDLSDKTKSNGRLGGMLGAVDEVFSPSRYESQIERDRQTILPAPAPVAGDGDHGIYEGHVRIDLGETKPKPGNTP